jgi:tetratricopeptide (TPR) repeat protein
MRLIPFLCLVVFGTLAISLAAQQPLIDSLQHSLRTAKPNSIEEANLNLQIGLEYYRTSNLVDAMEYLDKSRAIAIAINDTLTWARAVNGIGRLHSDKGEYPLALADYQQALRLASKINDLQLKAHIQKNIGVLYKFKISGNVYVARRWVNVRAR